MVGIIVAMKEEEDAILNIASNIKEEYVYNSVFRLAKIGNSFCVIVQSGVGKVNAARITQILIDRYKVECVINVGSAGALDPELNIGDIVVAQKVIQHDFDITAFNHNKGYITGVGDYIYSDSNILCEIDNAVKLLNNKSYRLVKGVIASGDIFCTDVKMKEKIYTKFNAKCVEMEGAAVAQVCYLDNIPFCVIRSISDSPNGKNTTTFEEYIELASQRCAEILEKFLTSYNC